MSRDYSNGKIYCIRNNVNDDIYRGSTTQALSKRMVKHRSNVESKEANHYKLYQKNEVKNFYIELVKDFPCETLEQLRAEEGKSIRQMGTLNFMVAGRDKKQHYEDNKEAILTKQKERYEENKEVILERNKNGEANIKKNKRNTIKNIVKTIKKQ